MFSKGKDEKKEQEVAQNGSQRNVIAAGTTIIGEIKSDGDFRIDGKVEGTIETTGRVLVGTEGFIDGNLVCANAEVEGKISGNIKVKELMTLKSTAVIIGDVLVAKIAIEPGATFDATCSMKGNVKNLNGGQKENKQKVS
ncbi:MAG: polymer-forming cytoskeletal protein [Flavobacteriales bacterium]|nr:polymer-forming cytoskeletal protein [Flavobacteriales bacterium]